MSHPQDLGFSNKKLSQAESEDASDFSEFSLAISAFRADLDCSISKALSLRDASNLECEGGAREGRGRRSVVVECVDVFGVCFEAVKKCLGVVLLVRVLEKVDLGVLKLEMSLKIDGVRFGCGDEK